VQRMGYRKIVLAVVLYVDSTAEVDVDGEKVMIKVSTEWPLSGRVQVTFENARNVEITVRLRVPKWAEVIPFSGALTQNYFHDAPIERDGFLHYPPRRYTTETVILDIPFSVQVLSPQPLVRQNAGCVALRRGPFIYAMESIDNDFELSDARVIPEQYLDEPITIGGMECRRIHVPGQVRGETKMLKFVPYWSWGNRGDSDVLVWCKTVGRRI
jgi:uncharacterized protein